MLNANCDKEFSSASFEGQIGKGIGKTCANEPVILLFPNNTPSSFPLDNMPGSSSTPPVAKIPHHPPNDPVIPLCEPQIGPSGVHEQAPYVKPLMDSRTGIREGQKAAQEKEFPSLNAPSLVTLLQQTLMTHRRQILRGRRSWIDAEASELRDRRAWRSCHVCCHAWKGSIKAEFIISNLEATRTWGFGNAPGDVELGGASWDIHAKDDTLGVIERYEARLAAQEARTDDVDNLVGVMP
jgi:hypothetical protein